MGSDAVPTVALPDGRRVPALGIGTWRMGERATARRAEVAAVRRAVELGATLVDTAEMYGDGGAESVVGEAIAGLRDRVFLVSKVLPSNASPAGTIAACERSLKRLRCERIDLYLLHWRGRWKLADTVGAFERLAAGARCATDQVYYALSRRGAAFDLLPWMGARAMPAMAYCPLDEGRLASHPALRPIALELGATCAQVALAWLLAAGAHGTDVIAIPKSASVERVEENARAAALHLEPRHLAALDRAFPPPRDREPLAVV